LKNEQENNRHAEKQTNKLWGVIERAQAFVTKGDEPVTVTPETFSRSSRRRVLILILSAT